MSAHFPFHVPPATATEAAQVSSLVGCQPPTANRQPFLNICQLPVRPELKMQIQTRHWKITEQSVNTSPPDCFCTDALRSGRVHTLCPAGAAGVWVWPSFREKKHKPGPRIAHSCPDVERISRPLARFVRNTPELLWKALKAPSTINTLLTLEILPQYKFLHYNRGRSKVGYKALDAQPWIHTHNAFTFALTFRIHYSAVFVLGLCNVCVCVSGQ